jgi:hypothetical protein
VGVLDTPIAVGGAQFVDDGGLSGGEAFGEDPPHHGEGAGWMGGGGRVVVALMWTPR